jgi:hypothetical protein
LQECLPFASRNVDHHHRTDASLGHRCLLALLYH